MELSQALKDLCDECFQHKQQLKHKHRPVYWLNQDITQKRKECHDRRRKVICNIPSSVKGHDYAEYKKAKAALKKTIKSSKRARFRKLCKEIDQDI
nr:unnamed protein product [Callosobruchus analis]